MIREIIGSSKIILSVKDECSVLDAIYLIVEKFPSTRVHIFQENEISKSLLFAVNGEEISHKNLETYQLSHRDELVIIPPAGGG
jgi:molybdopterin converting factor small subunit